jgi:multidrug resistance efflux pump
LLKEKIVSDFDYHRFLSTLDSLKAKITQLTNNLDQIESKLRETRALSQFSSQGDTATAINAKLDGLRAEQGRLSVLSSEPLLLRAPIDGIIEEVYRHEGENVLAGEPIARISGTKGERLVGYLRQPFFMDVKPGMAVQIRTRSGGRREGESSISGMGAQFEVITNAAFLRLNAPAELGLPLAFSIPPGLAAVLKPGELVDVIVRP